MPRRSHEHPRPSRPLALKGRHDSLINQVRQREQQLQTIIDTDAACVKLMSPDGLLLEMNRAGLALIEADDISQVAGRPVVDLIHNSFM